ncbi:MAG TPA: SAF domain-containing protein [Propionibacteriaceae bacterium]|nr:SAF domain-containing protein [Propionibacteriaceae bacterium]
MRGQNRRPRRPWLSFRRAVSWHRRKLAMLAVVAAVLTGLAAAVPEGPPTASVVRSATALAGGVRLTADDLEVAQVAAADTPEEVVSDPAALIGRTLAAPVPRGQVLTERAVVSARTSPGRVLAPLRLADAEATALLRPGDMVDVLAADPEAEQAFVAGRGVRVVTVPATADPDAGPDPAGALVLVEVDPETARVLARAAVAATLTVIWR